MKEICKKQQRKNKQRQRGARGTEAIANGWEPDKIQRSEIFTTFEKIHRSFLDNIKSEETKSQIKTHLSYLSNSYFYN